MWDPHDYRQVIKRCPIVNHTRRLPCEDVFNLLKAAFTEAPILQHFNPDLPIVVESDASDWAIAAIISQYDPTDNEIHPVAFHARTCSPAECNYDVYNRELLAIVEAFKVWRPYLEGAKHRVDVYSDHNNLQEVSTYQYNYKDQA